LNHALHQGLAQEYGMNPRLDPVLDRSVLDLTVLDRYYALALQTRCDTVNDLATVGEVRARMRQSIARVARELAASKAFIGPDLKLVVLPEYFLTGFPLGESIVQWRDQACLAMDDDLYAELGAAARASQVYLSGNAYELDANFPELYFQCSFVIDPAGKLILRYRRLISMFAPTPHDVWQRYLSIYGLDAVFPVVETEIGRLACIASEEILYPEIARAHALRGAEILLHSTSEVGSTMATQKGICKRARAIENLCFVVSANSAGMYGAGYGVPSQSTDGMSCIIDFQGRTLVEAGFGASMVANASVDLASLRAARRRVGMGNLLARQRTELFAPVYANTVVHPADLLAGAAPDRALFRRVQADVIARLAAEGKI